MSEEINYDEAFNELRQIMNEMQNDEISVDDLAGRVQRASELIHICNKKLRDTENRIGQIIEELGI